MAAEHLSIEYDKRGRMKYHPDFHFAHNKDWTIQEVEYLCKYWEVDSRRTIAFALGKTESVCSSYVYLLKKEGLYDMYKNLNHHW